MRLRGCVSVCLSVRFVFDAYAEFPSTGLRDGIFVVNFAALREFPVLSEVPESMMQSVFGACAAVEHIRSLLSETISVIFAETKACTVLICSWLLMHVRIRKQVISSHLSEEKHWCAADLMMDSFGQNAVTEWMSTWNIFKQWFYRRLWLYDVYFHPFTPIFTLWWWTWLRSNRSCTFAHQRCRFGGYFEVQCVAKDGFDPPDVWGSGIERSWGKVWRRGGWERAAGPNCTEKSE